MIRWLCILNYITFRVKRAIFPLIRSGMLCVFFFSVARRRRSATSDENHVERIVRFTSMNIFISLCEIVLCDRNFTRCTTKREYAETTNANVKIDDCCFSQFSHSPSFSLHHINTKKKPVEKNYCAIFSDTCKRQKLRSLIHLGISSPERANILNRMAKMSFRLMRTFYSFTRDTRARETRPHLTHIFVWFAHHHVVTSSLENEFMALLIHLTLAKQFFTACARFGYEKWSDCQRKRDEREKYKSVSSLATISSRHTFFGKRKIDVNFANER